MTPAEHKEIAEGLLVESRDFHPALPAHLALVTRAGVHATLALYREEPLDIVDLMVASVEPVPAPPEPVRPPRRPAKAKKAPTPPEDSSAA